ncbi:carbohydrate ABC transporter permease [uncultured Robinsoniella sp.]|uniref:carbohydrate ABC transporter permease n=1 Tax=uncultured Robinsoniella sp. TaxID=904190 RepID=UPI00374EC3EE
MKRKSKKPVAVIAKQILTYAVLIITLIISIMPLLWMWQAALVPSDKLNIDPFAIPTSFTWENMTKAWTTGKMNVYLVNSIMVAVPRVAGVLLLASLAGYAFGKLKFKGRDKIFSFMLFGMMLPVQAMVIPLYYNLQQLGLINTRWAMIIPYFGLSMPFGIFMMRAFFRDLPDALIESATIDGCNELTTFIYIMMPLIKPALSALLVFEFMWSWNDMFLPMLVVYKDTARTLPLGLMFFFGKYTADHSLIAAGVTICTLPIVIVYTLFQKSFISGITAGAVKG